MRHAQKRLPARGGTLKNVYLHQEKCSKYLHTQGEMLKTFAYMSRNSQYLHMQGLHSRVWMHINNYAKCFAALFFLCAMALQNADLKKKSRYVVVITVSFDTFSMKCWEVIKRIRLSKFTYSEQIPEYQNFFWRTAFWLGLRIFHHPQILNLINRYKE